MADVLVYGLIFLCGLAFGSFLTFLISRLRRQKPFLWGAEAARSRCPSCSHVLAAIDLIPVLSWILARGRCRYCKTPVPAFYPVTEVLSGIAFIGLWTIFKTMLQ